MALVILDPYDQPTRARNGLVIYKNGPVQTAMRSRSRPCVTPHLTRNPALNIISILSERWELLSNAQRIGWGNYAFASPLIDAWGNDRFIRGYAHYMRSNRPRLLSSITISDDPPSTAGFPAYTIPPAQLSPDNATVTVTPDITDDWASETGAFLLLWISRPSSTARTFAPETYQPLGTIAGDLFTPPPPTTFTIPTPATGKIRLWLRSAVTRQDGRYTSRQ